MSLCPGLIFLPFLCPLGGTQAVIIWIPEAVTLRREEKDRPLQDWFSLGRIFILLLSMATRILPRYVIQLTYIVKL
jgi:hypothetical protein